MLPSVSPGETSATTLGDNVRAAPKRAYEIVEEIRFDGMQYRHDIGHRAIGKRG